MRFSLITLLLFVLWIALGMTVWFLREPWLLRSTVQRESGRPQHVDVQVAPDGRRYLTSPPWGGGPVFIVEMEPGWSTDYHRFDDTTDTVLFQFKDSVSPRNYYFIDDDTIAFNHMDITGSEPRWLHATYYRRFPEWWWGHFYRIEVWLFVLTGIALLVRGIRSIRERKRRVSARGTVGDMCPGSSSSLAGIPA